MSSKNSVTEVKSIRYNEGHYTWKPEEFGFEPVNQARVVFTLKEFELRKRPGHYWLLRRILTKGTKKEILVKWYMKIKPSEADWAFALLTKGLQ